MKRAPSPKRSTRSSSTLGPRAFAAISAVEGLKLGKDSRERLRTLQSDETLTPAQRRAEVLRAYVDLSRKK